VARYKGVTGKELIFGLRPEHITEPRRGAVEGISEFSPTLDVVEPMGMETMVFFTVNGAELCGRVDPAAAKGPGESMLLRANVEHMHLIDPATDLVV
jgi:multiple sugar transport system ATP-binding protein